MQPPAVALRGICKRFGVVQANRDVDLTVAKGSVHGIVVVVFGGVRLGRERLARRHRDG